MNTLPPSSDADNGHPRNPSKDQSNKSIQQVCELRRPGHHQD